jgi:two-component system, chemotaxis family, sensor kinase CheA
MVLMKFRTKLQLGFGVIFVIMIVFSAISYQMISAMRENISNAVTDNYSKTLIASKIRYDISSVNRELLYVTMIQDEALRLEHAQAVEDYLTSISLQLSQWNSIVSAPRKALLADLMEDYAKYSEGARKVLSQINQSNEERIAAMLALENENTRQELVDSVQAIIGSQELAMEETLQNSSHIVHTARNIIGITILVTLLVTFIVATWVSRSIIGSIDRLTSVIGQVTTYKMGRMDSIPRVDVVSKDEIGSISKAYNQMAAALEQYTEQEKEYARTLEDQHWLKSTVADLTLIMQGVQELRQLTLTVIKQVPPLIGAQVGVIYLAEQVDTHSVLIRAASYGGGLIGEGEDRFLFGEGLIGQCAEENRMILLDEVEAGRLRIRTGLVDSDPVQVLIVPLSFRQEVYGVMEFAALQPFTEIELSLIEELAPYIGISIFSINRHSEIQKLLRESQAFTEELQTQSEELQLQQEELRTLNEQLEEQYRLSERKSSELERSKAEIEEKTNQIAIASQYKSEFMANMSHELRTPLNSLLILSQMLAENKEGNLLPKQLEFVRTIHSSGSDLLRLINDILDLAKVESGKMEMVYDHLPLRDLQGYVTRQFGPLADNKDLEFTVNVDPELTDMLIMTDSVRLQQVITNLLSNALKFTEKGGISLTLRWALPEEIAGRSELPQRNKVIAISVSDTGIGISNEKLAIIFEAFQQADGTTSRRFGGTGLGLSISKEITQLLGGFITVQSEEHKGSTFTLFIPYQSSDGQTVTESAMEAAPALEKVERSRSGKMVLDVGSAGLSLPESELSLFKDKKILIVDDDMRNIYALTTLLEAYGMTVQFAENGIECLDILEEGLDVHLILMDIMMPKMDGYESLRRVREMKKYATLPIIALTAKAMKDDRAKCIEAGASDYICKPIQVNQLLSLMSVWLQ